jgi:hypothetical protein
MNELPSGYPLLNGAYIEPSLARAVLRIMDPGLRKERASGYRLDERLSRLVDVLEGLAKTHVGDTPTTPGPAVRWISTKDAAALLGVSQQAVRDMTCAHHHPLPSRAEGNRILVEEGAVRLRAMNRADLAKPGKASQTTKSTDPES